MAWTTISNTAIDQDSPITVSLMTALRDNPAAIANGDSGAPRVQTAGIADNAITSAKIAAGAVGNSDIATGALTIDKFAAPSASGTYTLHRWRDVYADDRSSTHDFLVTRAGSYRITVLGDSGNTVTVSVNGSTVTTMSAFTSSSAQTYDVTVSALDELRLSCSTPSDTDDPYTISISCSQPFPFFLLRTSGWT